jgi:hypothetical protein
MYSALPGMTNRETRWMVLSSDIRKRDSRICGNVSLWNRRHVTDERLQYLGTTHKFARTWLSGMASQCGHSAKEICRWKDWWRRRRLQNVLLVDNAGKKDGRRFIGCPAPRRRVRDVTRTRAEVTNGTLSWKSLARVKDTARKKAQVLSARKSRTWRHTNTLRQKPLAPAAIFCAASGTRSRQKRSKRWGK